MSQESELGLAGSSTPEFCYAEINMSVAAAVSTFLSGEISASKPPQAVDRLHLLVVAGLRSLLSCWWSAGCSQ